MWCIAIWVSSFHNLVLLIPPPLSGLRRLGTYPLRWLVRSSSPNRRGRRAASATRCSSASAATLAGSTTSPSPWRGPSRWGVEVWGVGYLQQALGTWNESGGDSRSSPCLCDMYEAKASSIHILKWNDPHAINISSDDWSPFHHKKK